MINLPLILGRSYPSRRSQGLHRHDAAMLTYDVSAVPGTVLLDNRRLVSGEKLHPGSRTSCRSRLATSWFERGISLRGMLERHPPSTLARRLTLALCSFHSHRLVRTLFFWPNSSLHRSHLSTLRSRSSLQPQGNGGVGSDSRHGLQNLPPHDVQIAPARGWRLNSRDERRSSRLSHQIGPRRRYASVRAYRGGLALKAPGSSAWCKRVSAVSDPVSRGRACGRVYVSSCTP